MEIAILDSLSNTVDIIDAPDNIEDISSFLSEVGYSEGHIFFLANDFTVPVCRYKAIKHHDEEGNDIYILETT